MLRSTKSGKSNPKCEITHASKRLTPLPFLLNLLSNPHYRCQGDKKREALNSSTGDWLSNKTDFQIIFHITLSPSKLTWMRNQVPDLSEQSPNTQRLLAPGKVHDAVRDYQMSQMTVTPTLQSQVTSLQSQLAKHVQNPELTGLNIF